MIRTSPINARFEPCSDTSSKIVDRPVEADTGRGATGVAAAAGSPPGSRRVVSRASMATDA